jgi:tetratricopeptide (TPR) repeat protein
VSVSPRARLLVAAVALAASVTSLRNGFVYDDVRVVRDDQRIRGLANLPRLLASPYWSEEWRDRVYRPVTTASFAVDWAAGGGSPLPFHAMNVLLHVAVSLLVLTLGATVIGHAGGSVVAALFFAVHPVHVEAFANVVGRSELLAAAGYLGAVVAFLLEARAGAPAPAGGRRALWVLATLGCATIALGAKEHAVTLPLALVLADTLDARRSGEPLSGRVRRHALLWAAVATLVLGYLAARSAVAGGATLAGNVAAGLEGLNPAGRFVVMLPAFALWARLMVWPVHLSADYSPNAYLPSLGFTVGHAAGLVTIILAVALCWWARRRAPGVSWGIAWYAVTVSVAANVLVPTGVLVAERVLYLPSVGVAMAAGALWSLIPPRRLVWPAAALALTLLAMRTLVRIPVWRDEEQFVAALIRDAPESYRSHWALGARAFERGDARNGEAHYQRAIETYPADGALIQELGERYLAAGLYQPADRYLTAAFRVDTLRSDAATLAVLARMRAGRAEDAVRLAEDALRRFPRVPLLLLVTGEAYLAAGRPNRALAVRRLATYQRPDDWRYQHLAGHAAALAERCPEARQRLERARRLAPPGESGPRDMLERLREGPRCGLEPP